MAVKASTSFRTLETEGLHELLSEEEITRLRNTFLSNTFKHLSSEQFREALYKDAKISIDNNTFELLFKRINTKNDGYVTWDEFLSHLILGLKINEVKTKAHDLQIPISKKPRIFKSNHPSLVNYITFNPIVKHDRTYNYNEGNYITCSKDGTLNFWSLNMELKKKVEAKSTNLQATGTSILCIACLSDVSVLVTASTECDLRFYDTLARKFELRVQITTLPHPICSMNYVFHKNIKEKSQLIIGDTAGFLQVMSFSSELRGPFRSKPGLPLLKLSFRNLRKNHDFEIIKFPKVHEGWVQGVQYYQEIESIISCSTTPPGLIVWDTTKLEPLFLYNPHQGVWCFATADKIPLIASGGSDSLVRVWNPHVNSKPLMVFRGHRKAVTALMFESTGQILASLSEDRCIRVWDVGVQTCLQIYTELEVPIGSLLNSRCSIFYNSATSQIVIGATKITLLELRTNILRDKNSDGVTHASPITVLLYNPLFKVIITCGLDSHILVWDPVTGKRLKFIKHGHMRVLYGERVPVDITSGAFNPGYHLLITGAFDGNLKIWDFNTGSCLRNMETGHGCEITAIIWSDGRIITTSWNRKITEFSDIDDPLNPEGNFRKDWKSDHSDDILSMVARYPDTLVTGTYNGEIIFWNLVAGSTFAKYNVSNPKQRLRIGYKGLSTGVVSKGNRLKEYSQHLIRNVSEIDPLMKAINMRKKNHDVNNIGAWPLRGFAVRCLLFLETRPRLRGIGSLLVAVENGDVQVWSESASGGFIDSFQAVHNVGDYVIAMTTDEENEFLFAASTEGYIKTFLLKNYYSNKEEKIVMPEYRLKFPFMWKAFFDGRAKRALRDQKEPILLNSYRGHITTVTNLIYLNESKILVSSSTDCSVRLWTLGGRYLSTLGSVKERPDISLNEEVPKTYPFSVPQDLKRFTSSTTYKVFMGEDMEMKGISRKKRLDEIATELKGNEPGIYGKRLPKNILGSHFKPQTKLSNEVNLFYEDKNFDYVSIYNRLITPQPSEIPKLSRPQKRVSYYNQNKPVRSMSTTSSSSFSNNAWK